ncbi:response regulator receiver protein [Candidatus Koribacter versatilis Ellin345]|uniref:Response regulator receiver protein n=1 Tax=Koribacter versatilis (strain Ellin345) TaxID=204669 RepID=Q1IJ69_KORVE|nr:response regulator transcription factor [Candidatus Koribacter versatilis]ABF43081.1 response regulator receiver protein [Candidatus Koribacter versatilis Ellin345]
MAKAKVVLADDNLAILGQVNSLLDEWREYEVLAKYEDGNQLLREFRTHDPDIVVLDISMPGMSGLEVAARLQDAGSRAKIIFLTMHEDHDFLRAALGAGAAAYVLKSRLCIDLRLAMKAVLSHQMFVSPVLL